MAVLFRAVLYGALAIGAQIPGTSDAATSEHATSNHCALHNLSIDPIEPGRRDIFAGVGHTVRVEFRNDSDRDPVRVFPEPPMTIHQLDTNKSCDINGGIWVRDSVFLSEDEKLLVVLEFSGESNHLLAYNTGTCKRQGDIDVSDGRWSVNGSKITLGTGCTSRDITSCKKKRVFPVTKFCGS